MDMFTVRDLRERTGSLIHDAEQGQLSLVTKHGRPVFLAVPFSEQLLKAGLPLILAVHLYKAGTISLGKAAKLASCSTEAFLETLSALGILVVSYSPEEIAAELKNFE